MIRSYKLVYAGTDGYPEGILVLENPVGSRNQYYRDLAKDLAQEFPPH